MRRRGIVGIEAAIVLIAFVIVAAALAFVALNMGLFTTQKSKEVISKGLDEATAALEIDGGIVANVSSSEVTGLVIPLKISPGREAVDLSDSKTAVRLLMPGSGYEDVYCGVNTTYTGPLDVASLVNAVNCPDTDEFAQVFIFNGDNDELLEFGEKALLVIKLNATVTGYLQPYDEFRVEIRTATGAPLTVERIVPSNLPSDGALYIG